MPTTPVYAWPYPAPSDPNDPPADFAAALLAVEATLAAAVRVPFVAITRAATQNLGSATWGPVTWTAEEGADPFALWAPGAPTRLTVPAGLAGIWHASASADFAGGGGTRRGVGFRLNGAGAGPTSGVMIMASSASAMVGHTDAVLSLAGGDYLEAMLFQDAGGTLAIGGLNTRQTFTYLGKA